MNRNCNPSVPSPPPALAADYFGLIRASNSACQFAAELPVVRNVFTVTPCHAPCPKRLHYASLEFVDAERLHPERGGRGENFIGGVHALTNKHAESRAKTIKRGRGKRGIFQRVARFPRFDVTRETKRRQICQKNA